MQARIERLERTGVVRSYDVRLGTIPGVERTTTSIVPATKFER